MLPRRYLINSREVDEVKGGLKLAVRSKNKIGKKTHEKPSAHREHTMKQ